MMNQLSLAELLKQLRRDAGLTQEELAARAALSTRAISDLERGVNHTPRPSTLQCLVAALGLSDREREHFDAVARIHAESTSIAATADSRATQSPVDLSTARGAAALTPLIGRATERAILEQHLAGEGPPLLLVAGEPGIGKTRLLQEAAALGAGRGLNVLHGTVISPGDADSLDPIADALRRALQGRSPVLLRRDLAGCGLLAHILPELTSLNCANAESAAEGASPAIAASALLRFIANTAGPAGTLLTLDNLHDTAASGLALLARLVRSSIDSPVRVVAAYRDGHRTGRDPLSSMLARLAHEQLVRHLEVPRLSTREAADLLTAAAIQRGQTIDPWPVQALHDSGGVPFYIVAWAEDLDSARRQRMDAAIPWPIQQSLRFRIDAGPASVRPVLEVLAAIGGRATHAVLGELVRIAPDELQVALEWCLCERLVVEDDQAYAFAYDVVQTAVDSELSLSRRQAISRRMAAVVKRHGERLAARGMPTPDSPGLGSRRRTAAMSASDMERAYHLQVLRRTGPSRIPQD